VKENLRNAFDDTGSPVIAGSAWTTDAPGTRLILSHQACVNEKKNA
jgi:hypothetical protein